MCNEKKNGTTNDTTNTKESISDEALNDVSGGVIAVILGVKYVCKDCGSEFEDKSKCPKCGSKNFKKK